MKSRVIAAVLSVGMFCIASQASAFELFNMLGGGGYGCGCEVSCGHDHGCGCDRGCHKQRCCRERCHRNRCCHNTCGCDMAVPSCGAPVEKFAPVQAPSCGYAAPSCGCEPACGCERNRCHCKKQRCGRDRCCGGFLNHLKHKFGGCGCGCEQSCGCEPACGYEPACGFMGK